MEFTTRFELQSQATRLVESNAKPAHPRHGRDYHPLWCPVPRDFSSERGSTCFYRPQFGRPRAPDFHYELFPLHSPLLRESWLVSFPPLSYMFKFSGSSFLTWGLSFVCCLPTVIQGTLWVGAMLEGYSWEFIMQLVSHNGWALTVLEVIFLEKKTPRNCSPSLPKGKTKENKWGKQTLMQKCFQEYPEAQLAFKDLMIHWILQFTLRIAFRCVLHRCVSQDIRC